MSIWYWHTFQISSIIKYQCKCRSGETGRRAGLKIQSALRRWGFNSPLRHQSIQLLTFTPPKNPLYKTGWRKSEVMNLTWRMVDLSRKHVRLPPGYTKNSKPRIFPFDDELEMMFKRLWNEKEGLASEQSEMILERVCLISTPSSVRALSLKTAQIQSERGAQSFWNRASCHTSTHQNNQENPFYYPENSDKLIFIDKRGLNQ